MSAIKSRFDQPGYHVYSKLEELVLKAANKESFEEELKFLIDFYKDDFNEGQLKVQLDILGSNIPAEAKPHDLSSILDYVRGLSCSHKVLMFEVCVLVSLIIVMPATNATSERSFSALRTVKSYLKSTMTQTRLNSIMILSTHKHLTSHKHLTDKLDLIEIANEFVRGSEHRMTIFGTFSQSDC